MEKQEFKNIAIIKLSSLGDIIHTLPAYVVLKNKFPQADIKWIVEPLGAQLLKIFLTKESILVLPLKVKGFLKKLINLRTFLAENKKKFDLIIDFQGLLKSSFIAFLLKGQVVGFSRKNLKEPISRIFYGTTAAYFKEENHVIYKNLSLLSTLDINETGIKYPLADPSPSKELSEFMDSAGLQEKNYLILNIGGGWKTKLLQTNQYIFLINYMKNFFKIVILWGNNKEKEIACCLSAETGVLKTPLLNFSDLIIFIKGSRTIITSDTLALHLADMVNVPSIGIFGPTSPKRNGSLLKKSISIYKKINCSFCYKKKCDKMDCLYDLNIEDIADRVKNTYEKIY